MNRSLWVVLLPASAVVVGLGPGCSSSSGGPADAGCTGADATVVSLLSLDAGAPACQACVQTSCTAAITACDSDCTCSAGARVALTCLQGLGASPTAGAAEACLTGLPSASNAALAQVGTCLASCATACGAAAPDGGTDATLEAGDSSQPDAPAEADSTTPVDAPADTLADVPADVAPDATADAPVDSPVDAPAESSFIDAPVEHPDGGPAFYVITSAVLGNSAREGAIADFDEDGKLDLAIAGTDTTGAPGAVITLGDGTGRFIYETTVGGMGTTPEGIAVGDFDHDTHQDIVVGGFSEGPFIAFGKGDGTFKPAVSLAFANSGGGGGLIGAGDFNGDGYLDIAAGYDNGMFVLFNNKSGGFPATAVTANTQVVFNRFAIGDLNNDGLADLGYGDNSLWLVYSSGDGGTFTSSHLAGSMTDIRNVVFGDLDNNGHLDSIGSWSQGSPAPIQVTLQRANGTFQPQVGYGANVDQPAVIADFDTDTMLDVAASSSTTSSVYLFHGNGDGTLAAPAAYPLASVPAFILQADVNKDGKPDIVVVRAGVYATTLLQ